MIINPDFNFSFDLKKTDLLSGILKKNKFLDQLFMSDASVNKSPLI
jgi:hypothetical protein